MHTFLVTKKTEPTAQYVVEAKNAHAAVGIIAGEFIAEKIEGMAIANAVHMGAQIVADPLALEKAVADANTQTSTDALPADEPSS